MAPDGEVLAKKAAKGKVPKTQRKKGVISKRKPLSPVTIAKYNKRRRENIQVKNLAKGISIKPRKASKFNLAVAVEKVEPEVQPGRSGSSFYFFYPIELEDRLNGEAGKGDVDHISW